MPIQQKYNSNAAALYREKVSVQRLEIVGALIRPNNNNNLNI